MPPSSGVGCPGAHEAIWEPSMLGSANYAGWCGLLCTLFLSSIIPPSRCESNPTAL